MLDKCMKEEYSALCKKTGTQKSFFYKNRTLVLASVFLFITWAGNAKNYYVSNSGNDSNTGTAPETAWQSINKVNRSTFMPGDSILFKRGDTWDKDLIVPSSGIAGNPITISAYGEGDAPKFYGLKYQKNWEHKGGNLYATYQPVYYSNPALIGGEQKMKESNLSDLDVNHEWWQTNWDSMYVYLDNPADTNNIRLMTQNFGVSTYNRDYIHIENLQFVGVSTAVGIRNSTGIIVRNCTADSSFYFGLLVHDGSTKSLVDGMTITNSFSDAIYFANGADQIEVKNCTIINSGIATERYGDNQSIGMWNTKGDISIHDCYIEQFDGEWCIELTAEIKDPWKSYNGEVRLYNNVIKYNGGGRTSDARFISAWTGDYYIYNNLFIGEYGKPIRGVYTGEVGKDLRTRTYIYNNTFVGMEIGVISYQNNFYDPTTTGEGAVVVKNNIFSEVSDSYIRVSGGTDEYGGMQAFTEINNNLYFSHGSPTFKWGTKTFNFADWQTISGQDANSVTGDPLFVGNGDYSLQSGSPAINAGTDVGLTYDINSNPIVGAPDIGAYESNVTTNDTEKPTINGFTIPGTFDSLIVPVSTFTATDNISVTGFKITETATVPNADDAGWSDSAPTSYTFSSEGTKTLYAWAKDAVGNVSASVNDQVIITLPTTTTTTNHYGYTEIYNSITTDPYRRAMPVTFSESGEISSISVYHEGGTGDVLLGVYSDQSGVPSSLLGLTVSTVINSTAGWQTVPLVNPVEVTSGQTVWLSWVFEDNPGVRFTAGTPGRANSSDTWSAEMPATFGTSSFADVKYSIYCSLTETDVYKPIINSFTIPGTFDSLIVPVSTFTATDNKSVTGFIITESATAPTSENTGWMTDPPSSYTFSTQGTKTLYAWAKDAAGNISSPMSSTIIISLPDINTTEDISICEGESYNGWTTSGQYERTLQSVTGGDSIVVTHLTVNPVYSVTAEVAICEGETYSFGSQTLSEPDEYTEVFQTIHGCDSTVVLMLTVHPDYYVTEDITIVEGENYMGWTESETYERNLISSLGCDSTVITNLSVLATTFAEEYVSICDGSSYHGWTTSGLYERTLQSVSGGDSIVVTHLTVNPVYSVTEEAAICEGETYPFGSQTLSEPGEYTEVFQTIHGCDSTVVLTLTVHPGYYVTEDITIYSGESYNGWAEVGTYQRNLLSVTGCDSIVTTNLTVLQTIHTTEAIEICEGESYEGWTVSGVYERTLTASSGADSVVTTWLTVHPVKYTSEDIAILEGESYQGWTATGEYQRVFTSVNGCDSIVTTHLTVEPIPEPDEELQTQTIQLEKGWNVFSTWLNPTHATMDSVMKSLADGGELVIVEDEVPNTFEKMSLKTTEEVWVNNIGNVQKTEGYKIQVQSSCVLEITGTPVSLPVTIELKRGENLISFPINGSVDAMQVIQPLIDANAIKKVQDEKGNSIEKWRNLGWVNGIGNFQAGEGYVIDAKYDAILTIHEWTEKSGIFVRERPEPDYFKVCYEGNGMDHMNINMIELNATHFRTGDEIAAFDGEVCVGAVKLTESDLMNDAVSIPVSAAEPDGKHGFTEGNPIEIRVWHINKSAVSQTQSAVVEGDLIFQKRASVFVEMTAQTTTGMNDFESMKIDMYPNPARDNVTLRFSTLPEKGTRIELTDMAGRQLMVREVQSMQEVLNIQPQPAGMYLVKTVSGDNYTVRKLIIN